MLKCYEKTEVMNMSSPIGAMRNVKIFVLFLMENINYPLDFVSLNDIVMQTDYVMYLDFAESFHEMLEMGLIDCVEEDGEKYYFVTRKGSYVAREMKSDILSVILDQSLEAAFRYLDFKKRGIEVRCDYVRRGDGKFDLTCAMYEKKECIFQTTIAIDTEDRARRMREHFLERPEVVYRGTVALLTGKMNYLFD